VVFSEKSQFFGGGLSTAEDGCSTPH